MDDLVSRQAAIDALTKEFKRVPTVAIRAKTVIEKLPSAQPEQQWIPVNKKIPEEDVAVLVTDDAGGMTTVDVDRCGKYENRDERFWYYSQNVIAWMPLPEPYQEGER